MMVWPITGVPIQISSRFCVCCGGLIKRETLSLNIIVIIVRAAVLVVTETNDSIYQDGLEHTRVIPF